MSLNKIVFVLFVLFTVSFAQNANQKIYMFYTNDLQGNIERQKATYMNPNFPPVLGGGAAVQTVLKEYREKAEENDDIVLMLDAGNIFSGANKLGTASEGLAIIEYMNRVGYDAMVLGTKDFDAGTNAVDAFSKAANFPILAMNLEEKSNKDAENIMPYTVLEKGGLKIGVLGIVSKSAEQADEPQNVARVRFKAEVAAAENAVAELKKQNADIIIALVHIGLPYDPQEEYELVQQAEQQNIKKKSYVTTMELARAVTGIDVLISGGFNRGYQKPWEDPVNHTLCFQNYANGGNLGMATLKINSKFKKMTGYELPSEEQGLLLLSEDEFWPDAKMEEFIGDLQSKYGAGFDDVIGVTRNTLYRSSHGESPIGDLMCDAILDTVEADFAFNNYSGMRRDIPIGPITPRDLASVFPFGNEIVLIKLDGALLKELVETSVVGSFAGLAISGGKVVYDNNRHDGDKVLSITINGNPLENEKMYTIATTSYLAQGNSGMSKLAFLPDDRFTYTKIIIREAVERFVKKNSPLKYEIDGRWQKK